MIIILIFIDNFYWYFVTNDFKNITWHSSQVTNTVWNAYNIKLIVSSSSAESISSCDWKRENNMYGYDNKK